MIFCFGLVLALPLLALAEIAEENEARQREESNGKEIIVAQDSHILQEKENIEWSVGEDALVKTLEELTQEMQTLADELTKAQAEAERAEYEAHQQRIKNG